MGNHVVVGGQPTEVALKEVIISCDVVVEITINNYCHYNFGGWKEKGEFWLGALNVEYEIKAQQ